MVLMGLVVAGITAGQAAALKPDLSSSAGILHWMNGYRSQPDPLRAAEAIHALSELGELHNQESAGVYLGFAAGVLASNPSKADELVGRMLPMPAEDQWLVVRAVAYSAIPGWKDLLARVAPRVPARGPMLQKYLAGTLPTLAQYSADETSQGWLDRTAKLLKISFKPEAHPVVLRASPEILDTLWGYYFATGDSTPLQHIISLLPWAKDRDLVDRLTLGSMAKYTLAQNASRDPVLLATLKTLRNTEARETRSVLDEVIEAADDVDVSRLRREALAALDELKRKGSATKRDVTLWGQIGEGAVAAGCIAAAVAGQVELGIPCEQKIGPYAFLCSRRLGPHPSPC